MDLTETELVVFVVGAILIVIALIALIVRARSARQRRERLTQSFGSEYDRTVSTASRRRDAERDLQDRLDRQRDIDTHPIAPGTAEQFEQRLDELQSRFVDAPAAAVVAAEGLLVDIAVAAGYPDGPTEQVLGDISVDHPAAVAEHRRGQAVVQRSGKHSPSTEQLRAALVSTRHLCEALLAPSITERSRADRPGNPRAEADTADAQRTPPPARPSSGSARTTDDRVIELPEHERVAHDEGRRTSRERPGEGLT